MKEIKVKSIKEMDQKTAELRKQGYGIITFGKKYRELEKGSEIVVVTR